MATETNGVEVFPALENGTGETTSDAAKVGNKKKRLSVERIYQKKTQLEHILLRPDTYIGSVEKLTQSMWIMDSSGSMVQREITFVPGLYKIFDEILVNAADNKQRDQGMSLIKIDIKPDENMIRIWNNGKGIPVVEHREEKMFVPTMIFGHLLTSSNYDDSERKVTGGRNGYGAKLCNIFSNKFIIETSCGEYKKSLKQTWINNMTKTSDPKISSADSNDFTCVTFYPDLSKFKMETLDEDIVALFTRRAYDIAATCQGVKVMLNGQRLPVKSFKDYVQLYLKDVVDDMGNPLKVVHEVVNPRWEVAVALSNAGFQQVSFVNSIATTKGGRHVDHVSDQLVNKVMEIVKKKAGAKSGVNIKKFQISNHMWVFVNCLIENPSFDSQTKENMTLQVKNFGSKCALGENFIKNTSKCGIVESILNWVKFKAMEKMENQCSKSKRVKLKGIPKLDDANLAGTKQSPQCTLILTEGDSAKALAVAGLGVVGRDLYGVFPLRGKVLNVRDASSKQVMDNVEINNMIKILGLQYKKNYKDPDALLSLRYGKIMIMTDQDQDGSHIKGLIINFLHHNWPDLIRHRFVEEFITPIVKVFKGKTEKSFYSMPEFEEWKKETDNWHTYRVKYYKGLGTSTGKEAKDYFNDMQRHRIRFRYAGVEDDRNLVLAFGKSKADERKNWLTTWMEERKRRNELGMAEQYLYERDTSIISYSDFINKELILFSNMDNERSIPSMVDGFKPGQRKVLFACLKRNQVREVKVAQLAGAVAEVSAYHHGESSLAGTIVGLAQNFVGSNNINVLMPHGQFGTRLHGGKDAASPRYIFTCLSPLARHIFNANDEPMLRYIFDDNIRVEPEWYIPIIPMILINGAEGIGTGWACKVPNFSPFDIIDNLRRRMRGEDMVPMMPNFSGFRGAVQQLDENRYVVSGCISVIEEDNQVEITELPVRTWTQNYKESVIEPMVNGSEKVQPVVQDYKEYHTDTTVKFLLRMSAEKLRDAEVSGLHKFFKLSTVISTNNMVLFDSNGCLRRYASELEIMNEFYDLRLQWYDKRKKYLEGMLSAECLKLENQARFVVDKIEGRISIENRAKRALIQLLDSKGFDSDPVKKWRNTLTLLANIMEGRDGGEEEEEEKEEGSDFNYILNMPLWSLTFEKKEDLLKQRDKKKAELNTLRSKSDKDLWNEDLDALIVEMHKLEEEEKKAEEEAFKKMRAMKMKEAAARGSKAKKVNVNLTKNEFLPSPSARRVEPRISEFVMKVEAEKRKKQKREEKATAALDKLELGSDDDDMPMPLADRLEKSGTDLSDGLKKEPVKKELRIMTIGEGGRGRGKGRGRGGGGGSRGSKKAVADDGSPGKKKRKAKKKGFFGSGSDESSNDSDFGLPTESSPVRDRIPRRAATTVKYNLSSGGSDSDEFQEIDHGQGDRVLALPEQKSAEVADSDDAEFIVHDSDEVSVASDNEPSPPVPAPPVKTTKPRGGGAGSRGGRGRGRGGTTAGRGRGRGGGAGKGRAKKDFSDDSDSDDPFPKKKKKAAAPKLKKEPAKSAFDSDSSDEMKAVAKDVSVPLRERLGRAAASAKPTYVYDESDDDFSDDMGATLELVATKKRRKMADESDDEFMPEITKKQRVFSDSDDDY